MSSPAFGGDTAEFYLRYRRDLPADQAARIAVMAHLRPDDVLVDLGCGTGQIAVPMSEHCDVVMAVDPEPTMLAGLRSRAAEGMVCVLDNDRGLKRLGAALRQPVGAVTIGNALHWMDEVATLRAAASVLRPGGAVCIVTHGPPMWLGHAPWQIEIRQVLEHQLGPVSGNCRTDSDSLAKRVDLARSLGLTVDVGTWTADHPVDADWVLGHLRSAMDSGQLNSVRAELSNVLAADDTAMVEHVTTTAIVARRP